MRLTRRELRFATLSKRFDTDGSGIIIVIFTSRRHQLNRRYEACTLMCGHQMGVCLMEFKEGNFRPIEWHGLVTLKALGRFAASQRTKWRGERYLS